MMACKGAPGASAAADRQRRDSVPTRFQNVLQDFRAGVLSPRYSAQVNSEAFAHSLRIGQNFIISSQGGAAFREGMEFISYNATQRPFRLFLFRRGGDVSDLLIEVSAGQTRYWVEDDEGEYGLLTDNITILTDEDSGDFLIDEDSGDFLTVGQVTTANPFIEAELEALYFTNQAQYGILCHPNHPPTYITLNSNTTLVSEPLPLERIPQFVYNDYKSPQIVSELGNWKLSFPAGWAINGLVYAVAYNGVKSDTTYEFILTDAGVINAADITTGLDDAAAKQGIAPVFVVTPLGLLNYTVAITGPDSGFDITITPVSVFEQLPTALPPLSQAREGTGSDPVTEPAWSYPLVKLVDTLYYQCIQVHKSATENRPNTGAEADAFWVVLGGVKPTGYDYQNPNDIGWEPDRIYSPLDRGFPTVTVFHEQRLYFMANRDNPTSLYGSAIGQYFDFNPGPNDDEAVLYILDSSDTPEIKWARSQKQLILGTSSGEWTIGASESIITSTDITAQMQNASRAHLNMAVQVDGEIFYIEQGLRKLISTRYQRDYQTFYSTNTSLMAEHLVSTTGITRVVHSEIPETMLTMVTTDGRPLWLTYEKDATALAFTEGITDGIVIDVVNIFSKFHNRDYTWYAVNRNNRFTIERMKYPTSKDANNFTAKDLVFMDSWVSGTVVGSTLTGLEHLEQKTVFILIDDAWLIGDFVVKDGSVSLLSDYTGQLYAVGLPYLGTGINFEMSDNTQGTGLGTKRRWNRLDTRVLNSSLPLINGERAADRRTEIPMGESDNVRAGTFDIRQNITGYESKGEITVIQDRPYPLYIVGYFGQYQVEDD